MCHPLAVPDAQAPETVGLPVIGYRLLVIGYWLSVIGYYGGRTIVPSCLPQQSYFALRATKDKRTKNLLPLHFSFQLSAFNFSYTILLCPFQCRVLVYGGEDWGSVMRLPFAHHRWLCLTLLGLCMMPVLWAADEDPQEQVPSEPGGVEVAPNAVEKQPPAEAAPEKKEDEAEVDVAVLTGHVQLQFVSMPVAMESMEIELEQGEAKPLKVEAPTREFSTAYHVQLQESWAVGQSAIGEGRKRIFTAYGQADAPKMGKQVVLLVRKGERNADGVTVIPIACGPGHFDGGSIFMMNTAKVDIGCELGEEKFVLAPGQFRLVSPPLANGKIASIQVVLTHRRNENQVPFFSSKWHVSVKSRCLVGIQEDAENQRLKLQVIRDFEEVPEP